MLELIQITNDPAFARRCDALDGFRIFVDLERNGKAERQAGRDTFISAHAMADVARIKSVLRRASLMVRINPLHEGTAREIDEALHGGADQIMLPMFRSATELAACARLIDGRVPLVALLETADALENIASWIATPGLAEVYVGLNDLHLSLRNRFMFEPLASGLVDRVARACRERGLRFGFGGIARANEGLLPGRDVLAEHLRLGSGAVILSRTFHRGESADTFEAEVALLRAAERELAARSPSQVEADRERIAGCISAIAASLPQR